nr:hypothetical protein [uncultured Psychrobacter sp.]
MNTMMKVATAMPALALISACSTMAPSTPMTPATPVTDTAPTVAYDRMAPVPYTCTDNSQVMAKQSINKQQAMLTATLPKVGWSQQNIILNGGVQGATASYVNQSNPEVIYAWHMKGDEGILAMKWANGREYQVNCKVGR